MSTIPNDLNRDELWSALVQTAHALIMYNSHKRYVEDVLLKSKPDISPRELAIRLSIPVGEALVLLAETRTEATKPKDAGEATPKGDDRSLLDYTR
jgi:hypothetical protein